MKVLMFLVFFLLTGAFFIISNEQIHLNSPENIDHFLMLYSRWLDNLFDNGKIMTGYIVKMEWLPDNETISNNF